MLLQIESQSNLGGSPGFDTPEAANAWFGQSPEGKSSGGMEVVDEKVLAAATLPQNLVQQIETNERPMSPLLAATEVSMDSVDLGDIDEHEKSGKSKAQKFRKSE